MLMLEVMAARYACYRHSSPSLLSVVLTRSRWKGRRWDAGGSPAAVGATSSSLEGTSVRRRLRTWERSLLSVVAGGIYGIEANQTKVRQTFFQPLIQVLL
ncbi:unnamed protein product [Tuber aestivum]|uniref:Uncharacterized protein n=1 Tax=Tuber aestivum TaxID=59557 RepID=A0A292QAP7_9PEZI|nr:unnamed protein product [Tuber aestivum]